MKCDHCEGDYHDSGHQHEHERLCCDCFDLSVGMPLDKLNRRRADLNLPPIVKPWKPSS